MKQLVIRSEKGNPDYIADDDILSEFIHSEFPDMGENLFLCHSPLGSSISDGGLCIPITSIIDRLINRSYRGCIDNSFSVNDALHILKIIIPPGNGWMHHAISTAVFHWQISACKNRVKAEDQKTYIILDESTGFYKIGKSHDPGGRLVSLSTGKPFLKLIMEIDRNIENELHNAYSHKNVKGEWFNLSDNDLIDIYDKYKKKR